LGGEGRAVGKRKVPEKTQSAMKAREPRKDGAQTTKKRPDGRRYGGKKARGKRGKKQKKEKPGTAPGSGDKNVLGPAASKSDEQTI